MHVKSFTFNPFQENTYLLYDDSREGLIVDPGCYTKQEEVEILDFVKEKNIDLKMILNTHAHIDHVLGNQFIANKFGLEIALHELDKPTLSMVALSASMYGINYLESPQPSIELKEGESIEFGHTLLEIIHVPGHAPGHVVFYNRKDKIIIGGDVLFRGSIGRTDLPGGNHSDLIRSIEEKIFTLDSDIEVFPGHGPSTTIAYEKQNNPFF